MHGIIIVLILLLLFIVIIIAKRNINATKDKQIPVGHEKIQQTQTQVDTNNKIQTAFTDSPNSSYAKEQQSKEAVSKNAVIRSVIAKKKDQ